MKTLKKFRAQANEVKANLDAAILGLRNASLDQLMGKLEDTRKRLEHEQDLAWSIASNVLAKVKAVRESIQNKPMKTKRMTKTKTSKDGKTKTKTTITVKTNAAVPRQTTKTKLKLKSAKKSAAKTKKPASRKTKKPTRVEKRAGR